MVCLRQNTEFRNFLFYKFQTGLKFLFSGDADHFVAVLKAHWSFYSTFFRTLQKRNQLKKEVKQYTTSAIYNRSIVVDYFIRGKKHFGELPASGFIA